MNSFAIGQNGEPVALPEGAQRLVALVATTNASGVASASIKLNQKHGTYTVSAAFAGDSKYVGNSGSQTFTIGP